jgi:hypothetical protein
MKFLSLKSRYIKNLFKRKKNNKNKNYCYCYVAVSFQVLIMYKVCFNMLICLHPHDNDDIHSSSSLSSVNSYRIKLNLIWTTSPFILSLSLCPSLKVSKIHALCKNSKNIVLMIFFIISEWSLFFSWCLRDYFLFLWVMKLD